ncbi:hypothetical protein MRX96_025503 [Rhipicephalus microplus]
MGLRNTEKSMNTAESTPEWSAAVRTFLVVAAMSEIMPPLRSKYRLKLSCNSFHARLRFVTQSTFFAFCIFSTAPDIALHFVFVMNPATSSISGRLLEPHGLTASAPRRLLPHPPDVTSLRHILECRALTSKW